MMTSDARKRAAEVADPAAASEGTGDREALAEAIARHRLRGLREWDDLNERQRVALRRIRYDEADAILAAGFRRPVTAGLTEAIEALADELEQRPDWTKYQGDFARDLRAALAAAAPEATGNPVLADALRYYAERRSMANPKGWDHVLRQVEQGIEGGIYPTATEEQVAEARSILTALAAVPTPGQESVEWGVVLDQAGSADYYYDEAEARATWQQEGGGLIRTVTTVIEPWAKVAPGGETDG